MERRVAKRAELAVKCRDASFCTWAGVDVPADAPVVRVWMSGWVAEGSLPPAG